MSCIAEAVGQPFEAFTYAEQVHGNEVTVVSLQEKGMGRASRETAIQAKDGFITNEKGIVLCAQFADCVPLFFYDPVKRVAGLAHAGWKGTVLNISMATISLMTHTFGSQATDIRAAIGPSIGACCYEVDETVANRVNDVLTDVKASSDRAASCYDRQRKWQVYAEFARIEPKIVTASRNFVVPYRSNTVMYELSH